MDSEKSGYLIKKFLEKRRNSNVLEELYSGKILKREVTW
jgi:hypothetical protein